MPDCYTIRRICSLLRTIAGIALVISFEIAFMMAMLLI